MLSSLRHQFAQNLAAKPVWEYSQYIALNIYSHFLPLKMTLPFASKVFISLNLFYISPFYPHPPFVQSNGASSPPLAKPSPLKRVCKFRLQNPTPGNGRAPCILGRIRMVQPAFKPHVHNPTPGILGRVRTVRTTVKPYAVKSQAVKSQVHNANSSSGPNP